MAVDTFGRTHLTQTYSATVAFLHYWTPEIRQGLFGSFGRLHFDAALRGVASPAIGTFYNAAGPVAAGVFSGFSKDYNNIEAGSNLIWSPVRDLDIGVEAIYQRIEFLGGASAGRVADANKNVGGVTNRVVKVDDQVVVRFRVQRDF